MFVGRSYTGQSTNGTRPFVRVHNASTALGSSGTFAQTRDMYGSTWRCCVNAKRELFANGLFTDPLLSTPLILSGVIGSIRSTHSAMTKCETV